MFGIKQGCRIRVKLCTMESKLIKGYGYEAQQNSLFHVFVSFCGLDRAQTNQQKCFGYIIQPQCVSAKQKIVHGHAPSNKNLGSFVCSFEVCWASY